MKADLVPIQILRLGNPLLRRVCDPVTDVSADSFRAAAGSLIDALDSFRQDHGFGRAIAAPQIGVAKRLLALDLGEGPRLIVDPVVTWKSAEVLTLWDDCMSFPEILVKVRRHASLSMRFRDPQGRCQTWSEVDTAVSELLQHEIDHLDGVLAIDRAVDGDSLILRDVFDKDRERFYAQVDYPDGDCQ